MKLPSTRLIDTLLDEPTSLEANTTPGASAPSASQIGLSVESEPTDQKESQMAIYDASEMDTDDFIAASRKHARRYARRATEGIKDGRPDLYVHGNAVMANLYYAAALDAAHFGNLPEIDDDTDS
jgi:hypothetical protein